jgi:prepilin-type N-terminal cleavage/methylation domain-containing protein
MRHRKGFTIVELSVVVSVVALAAAQTAQELAAARARARILKDSAQAKQIHQAWIVKSIDFPNEIPNNPLPTPGLINPCGSVPGRGAEDFTKNDHASLYSASIAQNMISPPMCESPSEVSPMVVFCKDYDMTQYDPANDKYWDGDRKGEGVFGPDNPGHFKAELGRKCNVSYGTMPLLNPASESADILKKARRTTTWKNGGSNDMVVLGNRGVRDGIDGSIPGCDIGVFKASKTLEIHGAKDTWEGNLVFGDNHVDFMSAFYSGRCTKLSDPSKRVIDIHSPCAPDEGLDNFFREDDTTGLSDMWLCVVPWLTAKGQNQAAIPADHKLLFD